MMKRCTSKGNSRGSWALLYWPYFVSLWKRYQSVGLNLRVHLLAKFLTEDISRSLVAKTVEFPCHNGRGMNTQIDTGQYFYGYCILVSAFCFAEFKSSFIVLIILSRSSLRLCLTVLNIFSIISFIESTLANRISAAPVSTLLFLYLLMTKNLTYICIS
jgi:hypothetical protein